MSFNKRIRVMKASAFLSMDFDLITKILPGFSGKTKFSSIHISSHPEDFTIWSRDEKEQYPWSMNFDFIKTLKSRQIRLRESGEADLLVVKFEG